MTDTKLAELVECETHGLVVAASAEAHAAADRRAAVVSASAMEMNRRGIDFQPVQSWTAKHSPRRRARRTR